MARKPFTIRKPTHLLLDRTGATVGTVQLRGDIAYYNMRDGDKGRAVGSCANHLTGYGNGVDPRDERRVADMKSALRYCFNERVETYAITRCVVAGEFVHPDPSYVAEVVDSLGLRAISYFRPDGYTEYMPQDLIGTDGKTLVKYCRADRSYTIDGWEPWHDGMHGGRNTSILGALGWVQRAKDVRAGKATDFSGR